MGSLISLMFIISGWGFLMSSNAISYIDSYIDSANEKKVNKVNKDMVLIGLFYLGIGYSTLYNVDGI